VPRLGDPGTGRGGSSQADAPASRGTSAFGAPGREPYVDGVEVQRIGESLRVLDPQTGRLATVEYSVFVRERVRSLFVDAEDLRGAWSHGVTREVVAAQLADRGDLVG
jgi:hypothetical protein